MIITVEALCLLLALSPAAAAAGNGHGDCMAEQLPIAASAARRQDVDRLRTMAELDLCADLENSWEADYLAGYVNYRLADSLVETHRDDADALLAKAIDHLKLATAADPSCAACLALLSSAYGLKIAVRPIRGMLLGPKAGRRMKAAHKLGNHLAVVALLDGIGKLHTPGMFGGGQNRSLKLLAMALELFQDQQDHLGWGLVDAHLWYAAALLKTGDGPAASQHLRLALELEPEFAAAQALLERASN